MFFVRLKMNFPIDLKLLEYLLKKKKKKKEWKSKIRRAIDRRIVQLTIVNDICPTWIIAINDNSALKRCQSVEQT